MAKSSTNGNGRGMGLLLVFFPDSSKTNSSPLSIDSPSHSPSSPLLSKAQSTISICILLLFLTLFLFTLSTFEPSSSITPLPRRFLLHHHSSPPPRNQFALHGMGTLFLRGTKHMHDLIVAHFPSDSSTHDDLRLFLRLLHRSGVTSRSDVVLLLSDSSPKLNRLIKEENDSFLQLVHSHRNLNLTNRVDSVWGFDSNLFMKKKQSVTEPIWGKKTKKNNLTESSSRVKEEKTKTMTSRVNNLTESLTRDDDKNLTESTTELSYGSIVGFEVNELDPENSLSGFMDHVPINLRRWACYPMLLGKTRRSYKHVMLIDAKTGLIISDPLTRVRNRSSESVLLFKHNRRAEINPTVVIGGAKGVRRLASLMVTEIVRGAMEKKKKGLVVESGVLSQLVGNVNVGKEFEVVVMSEGVVEASSLAELRTRNSVGTSIKEHDVIQRGNSGNVIMKRICESELDSSSVYTYC